MKVPWLDKAGVLGSLVTLACCLGISWAVAFFSAIGVGFLINDAYLIPLLIFFLLLGIVGLFRSYRRHGRPQALILNIVSAASVLLFLLVLLNRPLVYVAAAGLVISSLWDIALHRRPGRM